VAQIQGDAEGTVAVSQPAPVMVAPLTVVALC
jgi:hypothetical protein